MGLLRRRQNGVLSIIERQRRTFSQLGDVDGPGIAFEDDDDDGWSRTTPWHTLLGPMSRATWRVADSQPPEDLFDAQQDVIQQSQRTSKQLRRTHYRIHNAQAALSERRERERRRVKNPTVRKDSLAHREEVFKDAEADPIYYGPEMTVAYLKQRLLPNYAIMNRVLSEVKSLVGPEWQPQRVVDFGIGCGSASAAALDVFSQKIDWVHGVDPSQSMRDCAEHILKELTAKRQPPPRITMSSSVAAHSSRSDSGGFDLAIYSYTAMELPHVASSLAAAAILWEKLRPGGIFIMVEPGTPDGFNSVRSVRTMLLDCCPPDQEAQPGDDQCHILAPCTHNGECPMERHRSEFQKRLLEKTQNEDTDDYEEEDEDEEDFSEDEEEDDTEVERLHSDGTLAAETDVFDSAYCSFVHTMPGGNRRSKGEKFSYIVAQKRIVGDPETDETTLDRKHNPFHGTNVAELLSVTLQEMELQPRRKKRESIPVDVERHNELFEAASELESRYMEADDELGLDFVRGDSNRKTFGRIIRAPIKKKGHVLLDYCSASKGGEEVTGRIVRQRIGKVRSKRVAPGLYSAARKARWGGFWPDVIGDESDGTDNNAEPS